MQEEIITGGSQIFRSTKGSRTISRCTVAESLLSDVTIISCDNLSFLLSLLNAMKECKVIIRNLYKPKQSPS